MSSFEERVASLVRALEKGNYTVAPAELAEGVGPYIVEDLAWSPNQAPKKAVCRCDIKNLLSTGHDNGCPEKKS